MDRMIGKTIQQIHTTGIKEMIIKFTDGSIVVLGKDRNNEWKIEDKTFDERNKSCANCGDYWFDCNKCSGGSYPNWIPRSELNK